MPQSRARPPEPLTAQAPSQFGKVGLMGPPFRAEVRAAVLGSQKEVFSGEVAIAKPGILALHGD